MGSKKYVCTNTGRISGAGNRGLPLHMGAEALYNKHPDSTFCFGMSIAVYASIKDTTLFIKDQK